MDGFAVFVGEPQNDATMLTLRVWADTNSMQNPKLPDWAVVQVGPDTPPTDESPGKVVAAGFFDEQWRL